jgi:hypothetical protein
LRAGSERAAQVRLPPESTAVHGQNATVALNQANPYARQAALRCFGNMPSIWHYREWRSRRNEAFIRPMPVMPR